MPAFSMLHKRFSCNWNTYSKSAVISMRMVCINLLKHCSAYMETHLRSMCCLWALQRCHLKVIKENLPLFECNIFVCVCTSSRSSCKYAVNVAHTNLHTNPSRAAYLCTPYFLCTWRHAPFFHLSVSLSLTLWQSRFCSRAGVFCVHSRSSSRRNYECNILCCCVMFATW